MKLISALLVSFFVFCGTASAGSSTDTRRDTSTLGYVTVSAQSKAKFSDAASAYSGAGASVDLMFHKRSFLWEDVGFGYSNFGSSAYDGSQDFSLNNLHAQVLCGLFFGTYFKGGYGLSFLKSGNQPQMFVGGGWKWGFGLKLHLVRGLYADVETMRWDGPGPIGFRTQSVGAEYHF